MKRKFYDARKLARIAANAIAGGYGKWVADRQMLLDHPDCDDPFEYSLYSRGGLELVTRRRILPITISGAGRCRKCPRCKRRVSRMWMARAIDEYQRWPRTIFGTFTLSPANHDMLDNRARVRLAPKGVDFDALQAQQKFTERAKEFGDELTNWIKRVRSGRDGRTHTPCRYLLIAEVHDSEETSEMMRGRPHYHILVHELIAGAAIKGSPLAALAVGKTELRCDVEAGEWEVRMVREKDGVWRPHAFVRDEAFIRQNWTLGFTKFEWASDAKAAYYVCKYVSKSILNTRVRCSKYYGNLEKDEKSRAFLTKLPRCPHVSAGQPSDRRRVL